MFTKEQLQLQSLVESGLVPAWRLDFARSIANTKRPTAKQLDWVQKILDSIVNAPAAEVPLKHDFKNIFDLFATASKNGLKWPKVALVYEMDKSGRSHPQHKKVLIKVQGPNSRSPGALALVVDGVGYCGCIHLDHTVFFNRAAAGVKDALLALMIEFNKDPKKMASDHGKLLSSCCYCRLPLSTAESLAVGYGDTCAKHWGLPWGKIKMTDAQIMDLPS